MKLLAFLLISSFVSFGQTTPEEFARNILSACINKDIKAYEQYIAKKEDFAAKLINNDPTTTDEQITKIYTLCSDRAITGFKLWHEIADELKLDFKDAKITDIQVQDVPFKIFRDGKEVKTSPTKTIKIFFNCHGKNLCFQIRNVFYINEKWLLGYDYIQLELLN